MTAHSDGLGPALDEDPMLGDDLGLDDNPMMPGDGLAPGGGSSPGVGRADGPRAAAPSRARVVVLWAPARETDAPAVADAVADRVAELGGTVTGARCTTAASAPASMSTASSRSAAARGGGPGHGPVEQVHVVELGVLGADLSTLRRELLRTAAAPGLDVAVLPAGVPGPGRLLFVLDVDSTFIKDEVIELLAAEAGAEGEVAAVTEAAMRGELDFAASLHARVAELAGLPEGVLERVRARIRLTPGAAELVRAAHDRGDVVALVSGGFVEVVGPLAAELGIRHLQANRLEVADGVLTGRVSGPVVDRAGKARSLREVAAAEGIPPECTVAVGDGANDLDMLAAAGLGVAFNAKPIVRAQADAAITLPRLDAVLGLLGDRDADL